MKGSLAQFCFCDCRLRRAKLASDAAAFGVLPVTLVAPAAESSVTGNAPHGDAARLPGGLAGPRRERVAGFGRFPLIDPVALTRQALNAWHVLLGLRLPPDRDCESRQEIYQFRSRCSPSSDQVHLYGGSFRFR